MSDKKTIKQRLRSSLKDFLDDDETVLRNGLSFKNKRDVDDPSPKFTGVKKFNINYNTQRNVNFYPPEYDLPTIANAIQMDGLLRRAVNIFVEQILKNGYETVSKSDAAQEHVTKRINEIQNLTGKKFHDTLSDIASQLVQYGNAYLLKVRKNNMSVRGNNYRLYGKNLKPIVGLFVLEATTMEFALNTQGTLVGYKQRVNGQEITYDERDVIHFTYNKIPGTLAGMSSILPVLDDVRALRKLEEEVEILGFQYAIPLYLYKIGNKDQPAQQEEIDEVSYKVENSPPYGMMVVPGHHTIEIPSNKGSMIDIMEYVNHFKHRVYSGLGVAPVAMGEISSSNRNTSEISDMSMQTITNSYQNIIKNKTEMELIRELLLDGNFKQDKDIVEFNFPEIDLENMMKKENHVLAMYQGNLISQMEARHDLGYDKLKLDEPNSYLQKVQIPLAQATAVLKDNTSASNNKTSNKNQPTNQYGKSSGNPKIKKDSQSKMALTILSLTDSLLLEDGYKSNLNIQTYKNKLSKTLKDNVINFIDSKKQITSTFFHIDSKADTKEITNFVDSAIDSLNDKIDMLSKNIDSNDKIKLVNDSINEHISTIYDKAENLSLILLYKSLGYRTILFNATDCDMHSNKNQSVTNIDYNNIPPVRYNCNCKVSEKDFYGLN